MSKNTIVILVWVPWEKGESSFEKKKKENCISGLYLLTPLSLQKGIWKQEEILSWFSIVGFSPFMYKHEAKEERET